MEAEKKYIIGLNSFIKFGSTRLNKLFLFFQSWERAYQASSQDLIKAGIEENIAQEFIAHKNNLDLDKVVENINKEQIKITTIHDDDYPHLLKEIFDPPTLLYYRGDISCKSSRALAIVGSRKYTNYAKEIMASMVADLTRNDLLIVSGLALGIDALAHQTALEHGSKTMAVLGSGIDNQSIYPRSNYQLAQRILEQGGTIISEFPPKTPALPQHFPLRNRIVSGMCRGVLIVEAREKSGSLITAHTALDQNREVFAVPGNINSPNSQGPNNLIKNGAYIATCAEDILNVLEINKEKVSTSQQHNFNDNETIILKHLSKEPVGIDKLGRLTKLDTKTINSTLSILELKRAIKDLGSKEYIIN